MKHFRSNVALAAIVVFLLGRGASAQKVTLWTFNSQIPEYPSQFGAGMKAAEQRFEALNPGVDLEILGGGGDLEKLLLAIGSGQAPDVALVNGFLLSELTLQGVVQSIDAYLSADTPIKPERMAPGHWEMVHGFDGRLYGVGALIDNVGFWSLYYNRELLAQAGFDADSPPKTWNEMLDASSRMTIIEGDGQYRQLGYQWYDAFNFESHHWVRSAGLKFFSEDGRKTLLGSPGMSEVAEFLITLGDRLGGWQESQASGLAFQNGEAAMRTRHEDFLNTLAVTGNTLDFDITYLPTPTGDHPAAWTAGWAFAVPQGAPNVEGAVRVVEFLASEEFVSAFMEGFHDWALREGTSLILPGAMYFTYPELVREMNIPLLRDSFPKSTQALAHFLDAHQEVSKVFTLESTPIQNEWVNMVNGAFKRIVMEGEPANSVLGEAARLLQVRLDEEWKRYD